MTVHADCSHERSDSANFQCDECAAGFLPLYNTLVWAKVGIYRWWPAFILTAMGSERKERSKLCERQFCVQFLGTNDYYWVTHERVFPYSESFKPSSNAKNRLDASFILAIKEADELSEHLGSMLANADKSIPKSYRKIQQNQPIAPVKLMKDFTRDPCDCSPDQPNPCGFSSGCISRVLNYECGKNCPAGESCLNQKVRKRENAGITLRRTRNKGYGAFAKEEIMANTFVIEYIGELVDSKEIRRRIAQKHERGGHDIYFLGMSNELFIDAEPAGNYSRFINHSCDPNCRVEKIDVDGNVRAAIYSNYDIQAVRWND